MKSSINLGLRYSVREDESDFYWDSYGDRIGKITISIFKNNQLIRILKFHFLGGGCGTEKNRKIINNLYFSSEDEIKEYFLNYEAFDRSKGFYEVYDLSSLPEYSSFPQRPDIYKEKEFRKLELG